MGGRPSTRASLIDYRRGELQTEAIYIGERVYTEKPEAFRRRMRRYWTAGRAIANAPHERHPAELADATRALHATLTLRPGLRCVSRSQHGMNGKNRRSIGLIIATAGKQTMITPNEQQEVK